MKSIKKKLITVFALLFLLAVISPANTYANECTEHQWGEWYTHPYEKETCGRDGIYYRRCQLCDASETKTVPATGEHSWDEWYDFSKPSCLEDGIQRRFCTVCYEYESRPIPAIGYHTWSDWEIIWKPTCDDTGYKFRECIICHEEDEEDIPKTDIHSWEEWEISKKATALSVGKKVRFCSECDTKETKEIPKLKAKVSLKNKSVTIEQNKSYTLKIKSKTYGDKIEKWSSDNTKIATVNSNGKVTGKKEGITQITLKMISGVKASCKIKVTKPKTNNTGSKSNNSDKSTSSSGYVWIPSSGKKYHKTSTCSGMKNPSKVTIEEAKNAGYEPCSKCY